MTVPLLVLHAAGLDGRCADLLGMDGIISVTMLGHGERAPARRGLSLLDMADEVVGWTSEPLDVVGLSLGGMVAMHLALAHPRRIRSLVLACTTARTDTRLLLERAEATKTSSRAETERVTLQRWFTAEALGRDPVPLGVEYARSCLRRIDKQSFAEVWRAISAHDVLDRLSEIYAPTTCVAGTHDISTPPDDVADMAHRLPDARLVRINAAHMALLEQPHEFRQIVLDHLAWITGHATGD